LTKDQILENLAAAGGVAPKAYDQNNRNSGILLLKNSPGERAGHEAAI
jgi:hypothetical protein